MDEIGYFQIGDNPGRKEPGTGEMNYKNIFKHIAQKAADKRDSCSAWSTATRCRVRMASGLIEAYVAADAF